MDPTSKQLSGILDQQAGVHTISIENGTQLVVTSMSKNDVGDYVCEASDMFGSIETSSKVRLYSKFTD